MKKFRITLAVAFIAAFTIIACEKDETPTDTSGTGSPPSGTDVSNVCSQEACANDPLLAQECQSFLDNCIAAGEPERDCTGAAWVKCNV